MVVKNTVTLELECFGEFKSHELLWRANEILEEIKANPNKELISKTVMKVDRDENCIPFKAISFSTTIKYIEIIKCLTK